MPEEHEPKKVTVWLPRYAARALREEAFRRETTMGAIVLEALQSRIIFFDRNALKDAKGDGK